MPSIQIVLATDIRQSPMIQMEYKRLGFEVMILRIQSPNNGVELFIINGVVES